MPIYAYRCDACGHTKDVLQKISDAPLTVCPKCGQASFAKALTAPAFQLKGSGWYVTDFRDNGKKPGSGSGSEGDGADKAADTPTASSDSNGAASTSSGASGSTTGSPSTSGTTPAPAAAPSAPAAPASGA